MRGVAPDIKLLGLLLNQFCQPVQDVGVEFECYKQSREDRGFAYIVVSLLIHVQMELYGQL